MPHIDVRIEITPDTVDEETTETFVKNFLIQKFEFIEKVAPVELDEYDRLEVIEERAVTRAQSGEGN